MLELADLTGERPVFRAYAYSYSFIFQPTNTKALRPTQVPLLLATLTSAYTIDLRPPSDGFKILGVPKGSLKFVTNFISRKMEGIDESLASTRRRNPGRTDRIQLPPRHPFGWPHDAHTPPYSTPEAMTQWRDFLKRQSAWFEVICNITPSVAALGRARPPRSLKGPGFHVAEDVAPCAYVVSLI